MDSVLFWTIVYAVAVTGLAGYAFGQLKGRGR